MKRKIIITALIAAGLFLCLCFGIMVFIFLEDPALATLPRYHSRIGYISDGFQDYTIYREYHYSNSKKMSRSLERSPFFEKVKQEDVEVINGYLDDFKGWLTYTDFENECKFDSECIDTSDYWCLFNKWEDDEEECLYFDYDLYYYDSKTMTMFMIHSNI